ncbi:hypothetical protein [Pseudooceanicola nanhaiensis]|uniref:hypothetical protein n=1 Tax=Pseudooceanicola nanhaiensis TaxID=375761 RepID=UPI003517FF47
MADPRAQVHALMRGLVTRHFPSQQSAAKEMGDFWHPTGDCGDGFDTADLSRKMNGSRTWTFTDIIALQAITGSTRVTDAMAAVGQDAGGPKAGDAVTILQHARALIKEGSEGASALVALEDGGSLDEAVSELLDIIEVAQAAITATENRGSHSRNGSADPASRPEGRAMPRPVNSAREPVSLSSSRGRLPRSFSEVERDV